MAIAVLLALALSLALFMDFRVARQAFRFAKAGTRKLNAHIQKDHCE